MLCYYLFQGGTKPKIFLKKTENALDDVIKYKEQRNCAPIRGNLEKIVDKQNDVRYWNPKEIFT